MELFRDIFNSVPVAKVEEFQIYSSNDIPIRTPPRMIPQAYKSGVDIQIQDILDRNIIRVSNSPWLSPPVIIGKKDRGLRFYIDYRGLNIMTQKDAYPLVLTKPDQVQDKLSGMSYFTKFDLNSGYWQISVSNCDRQKTAFSLGPAWDFTNLMSFHSDSQVDPAQANANMDQVLRGFEQSTDNFIDV